MPENESGDIKGDEHTDDDDDDENDDEDNRRKHVSTQPSSV